MATSMINAMCRCCASEGVFKDVKSTYHWMGDEEIYADMLKECFDVSLFIPEEGAEGGEGGICEVCITQLRNAVNFKKQVLHTEEQFKRHVQNKLFKPNIVKVEVEPDDDNDSDDNNASAEEGYSGAEYEIPIKKEVPEEPKPKKRAAAVKASTSRAKKAKTEIGEPSTKRTSCDTEIKLKPGVEIKLEPVEIIIEPVSTEEELGAGVSKEVKLEPGVSDVTTKPSADWILTVEKKCGQKGLLIQPMTSTPAVDWDLAVKNKCVQKGLPIGPMKSGSREIEQHLHNIRTILLNSNATPIRGHTGVGYTCCYCKDMYPTASDLKTHSLYAHDDRDRSKFMDNAYLPSYIVKLDITGLLCKICNGNINAFEEFVLHLSMHHDIMMYSDIRNHIVPFKFDNDTLNCTVCASSFDHFKLLQEHMNMHYGNYSCEKCNALFINIRTLKSHMKRHEQGEFACSHCTKVFVSERKRLNHEKFVHIADHKRNKCPICEEKFTTYAAKCEHLAKMHGIEPRVLHCTACDKTFTRRDMLWKHTKRDHLMQRNYQCDHCNKRFHRKRDLVHHMVTHTGEKPYKCQFCLKSYGQKQTLTQHLRIHANDKRFKCEHCGIGFVQKCSWKRHMRAKHEELV